jgi:hypothetical protein
VEEACLVAVEAEERVTAAQYTCKGHSLRLPHSKGHREAAGLGAALLAEHPEICDLEAVVPEAVVARLEEL